MEIKGLSKYEITETPEGKLKVWSKKYKRYLKPQNYYGHDRYYLVLDATATESWRAVPFYIGHFRMFKAHPEFTAHILGRFPKDVFCDEYGNLRNKGGKIQDRSDLFRDAQDALQTAQIMVEVAQGNLIPLVTWLTPEIRERAVGLASRRLSCSREKARRMLPVAEEKFIELMASAKVNAIRPLFYVFYSALLNVMLRDREKYTHDDNINKVEDYEI